MDRLPAVVGLNGAFSGMARERAKIKRGGPSSGRFPSPWAASQYVAGSASCIMNILS
jgi:hypothetical protein